LIDFLRIDILYEGTRDFYFGSFYGYGFNGWDDYLQKAKKTGMPKYLPIFNKVYKN
jgi:hypothetical protein